MVLKLKIVSVHKFRQFVFQNETVVLMPMSLFYVILLHTIVHGLLLYTVFGGRRNPVARWW
jgi:hypothetical protein